MVSYRCNMASGNDTYNQKMDRFDESLPNYVVYSCYTANFCNKSEPVIKPNIAYSNFDRCRS